MPTNSGLRLFVCFILSNNWLKQMICVYVKFNFQRTLRRIQDNALSNFHEVSHITGHFNFVVVFVKL